MQPHSFYTGTEINIGGETTSTGRRAMVDLAHNNNTLFGQIGNQVTVCFGDTVADIFQITTSTDSSIDLITFRVLPMNFAVRAEYTVELYINKSSTDLTRLLVYTEGDSLILNSTTAGLQYLSGDVGVDVDRAYGSGMAKPEWVSLRCRQYTAGTCDVLSVRIFQKKLAVGIAVHPSTAISGGFVPAGVAKQHAIDYPLSVKNLKDLASSVNQFYRDTVRNVVQWAWPLSKNPSGSPMLAAEWGWVELGRFHYRRSPGVAKLAIFANGYTASWTSGSGIESGAQYKIMVHQGGQKYGRIITFDQSSATWDAAGGTDWHVENQLTWLPATTAEACEVVVYGRIQRFIRITAGGSGYAVGDTVVFSKDGLTSAFGVPSAKVSAVDGSGAITAIGDVGDQFTNPGSNIEDPSTIAISSITTSGGSSGTLALDVGQGHLQALSIYEVRTEF
jgi:hypothetical protein